MASEEAWEPPLAWECLGSSSGNCLGWKGHSPLAQDQAAPLGDKPGIPGSETPYQGPRAGPSPGQREGCALPAPGHKLGRAAVEMGEFREPHTHLPASGLSCGPREGSKEEGRGQPSGPGAHGATVQRPYCLFGVLVQLSSSPPLT